MYNFQIQAVLKKGEQEVGTRFFLDAHFLFVLFKRPFPLCSINKFPHNRFRNRNRNNLFSNHHIHVDKKKYGGYIIVQYMNDWRGNRQLKAVFIWAPMEFIQSGLHTTSGFSLGFMGLGVYRQSFWSKKWSEIS